jgi:hypothetical protein
MLTAPTLKRPSLFTLALLGACSANSSTPTPTPDSGNQAPTDSGIFDLGLADAVGFADAFIDAGEWPDAEPPDTGIEPDSGVLPLCPPQAPFGITNGSVLPPTILTDCDGNERTLQDLCDKKASWMFVLAGW